MLAFTLIFTDRFYTVSYTLLSLPTNREVEVSGACLLYISKADDESESDEMVAVRTF